MHLLRADGRRVAAWTKSDPVGAEFAQVDLSAGLHATGTAIGSDPQPYRLDYTLQTDARFVTRRVEVRTAGQGWARTLELTHELDGWRVVAEETGSFDGPPAGGDVDALADALDADLGLSPVFNTMPVLRHGLLRPDATPADLLMVWIAVPELQVHASRQRYSPVRPVGARPALVRFETVGDGDGFRADIEFDADGLVVDYPGLASRLR